MTIDQIITLIVQYGLPLVMLVGGGFALYKRWVRLGPDVDSYVLVLTTQLGTTTDRLATVKMEYSQRVMDWQTLYERERKGREDAESRIASNTEALRQGTAAFVQGLEVVQAQADALAKYVSR